jgi:hypothetical protein
MIKKIILGILLMGMLSTSFGSNWYVATNGTGQGTSWADATNNLQGAISGCVSGSTCWVSNGLYKPANLTVGAGVTIRSLTGNPADVLLDGNAAGNVVIMTNPYSSLIGLTISNGLSFYGSGVYGAKDGFLTTQYGGMISNCLVIGNVSTGDAAVMCCDVYNSIICANISSNPSDFSADAGGAIMCSLFSCVISNNISENNAGGLYECFSSNCIVVGNFAAGSGGGILNGATFSSVIFSNIALQTGGGVSEGTIYNSIIKGNICGIFGGGTFKSAVLNCTMSENSADMDGDGTYSGSTYNSISLDENSLNEDGLDYYSCGIGYTGTGSITNDPLFVSSTDFHLQSGSPCIGSGTNGTWTTNALDLAGNIRIWPKGGQVDMGAYEYGSRLSYGVKIETSKLIISNDFETMSIMLPVNGIIYFGSTNCYIQGQNGTNFFLKAGTNTKTEW